MKQIIFNQSFSEEELKEIQKIKDYAKISLEVAKILFSRNIRTESEVERFLNKGKHNFSDPFSYKGVTEAVSRIKKAKENDENVLIYGDYDADGISAVATLYHSLKDYGIKNLYTAIPEREDGYGLNEDIVTEFAENYFIDLLITVDCGISDCKIVDFIMNDLGVDVIITDHHEIPEVLPQTIVINPKLKGQGCFDGLCGAGVAFKLSSALIGEKANNYLDYVALATIADSMNVINENRDIVYEGLKLFENDKIKYAFKCLISSTKAIDSQSLAFMVAPRINAAGRMGDANSALNLFLSEDNSEIEDLAEKLNEYNILRQTECDKVYKEAKMILEKEGAFRNVIMLYNENWNVGFVGIVASKLLIEYSRPVIMFAGINGMLKGSARSIDGVNIFEAISSCKELTEEFGGHSQAAGVSIKKENFEKFYIALDKYLSAKYDLSIFIPKINVEKKITEKLSFDFVKELEVLEPTGVGNRKPLFLDETYETDVSILKNGGTHISFKTNNTEMIYFNGIKSLKLLKMPVKKNIIFESNMSFFNNRNYIKGYVKEIIPEYNFSEDIKNEAFFEALNMLKYKTFKQSEEYLSHYEVKEKIKENLSSNFGTCYLINDLDNLSHYPELKGTDINIFEIYDTNLLNTILYCPLEADLSGFRNIIYLDKPISTINIPAGKSLIINKEISGYNNIGSISVERNAFTLVFINLRKNVGKKFINAVEFYKSYITDIEIKMYMFALSVFLELNIFYIDNEILLQNTGVKTELTSSEIYKKVCGVLA